jgi:hypothetical protein
MDEHLYDDLVEQIREVSLEVKVSGTEKCFIQSGYAIPRRFTCNR